MKTSVKILSVITLFLICNLLLMHLNLNAQSFVRTTSCHSLLLKNDATVWVCGMNYYGSMGDGTLEERHNLSQVNSMTNVISMAGGWLHTLFVKSDGYVWACGDNRYGELGDGTTIEKHTPVQIPGLSNVKDVGCGSLFSIFLKNDGTVWSCGYNDYGQLGDGSNIEKHTPIQMTGLTDVTSIECGIDNCFFLKSNGTVWACGADYMGKLGMADNADKNVPTQIAGLTNVKAIASGYLFTLFLKNDGTVWACGYNGWGQFANNLASSQTPVQISGLSGITAIAAGADHSLFLKSNGTVLACGLNQYGSMGNGTTSEVHIPTLINGLSGITSISAGAGHSIFLKNDGTFWGCGRNGNGQLGDGSTTDRYFPVQGTYKCVPPVFNLPSNEYNTQQTLSVTLTNVTVGATIKYTINGSAPTQTNGTIYTGAISVSTTTTIKAFAYKSGLPDSDPVSETYTFYIDTDGDGVIDSEDAYPNDPTRSFNNYFPAAASATLAFEDLWPSVGDYDLNDVVVDYQFKNVMNANNMLVETIATFVLRATGAGMHNGFGFQLASNNILASDMQVTGSNIHESYLMINANGTEQGQNKPTIIVFDNAFDVLKYPGSGLGINTTPAAPYVAPVTITIHITYTSDTYYEDQLDIANFNPFIIVNKIRGKEVHLPDYPPTALANPAFFGTADDNSIPAQGRYYKTMNNLPWALNLYNGFSYPIEKAEVAKAYLHFIDWVISNGNSYTDWYTSTAPGYRDNSKIYVPVGKK